MFRGGKDTSDGKQKKAPERKSRSLLVAHHNDYTSVGYVGQKRHPVNDKQCALLFTTTRVVRSFDITPHFLASIRSSRTRGMKGLEVRRIWAEKSLAFCDTA
jgi:hypothetical protein